MRDSSVMSYRYRLCELARSLSERPQLVPCPSIAKPRLTSIYLAATPIYQSI
jgi:hypothetical protein